MQGHEIDATCLASHFNCFSLSFPTPLSPGTALALTGVFLYSQAKRLEWPAGKKKDSKAAQ